MLESVTVCYRVLQSVREYDRVWQSMTEYYRVLQSITEFYRVFLAHLLGPIFGLVFLYFSVKLKRNSGSHIPTTLKVARIIFGGFFEINNSRNFQEYIMYFEHTLKLVGASNTSCNKFREVETKTSKRRRHSPQYTVPLLRVWSTIWTTTSWALSAFFQPPLRNQV